MDYSVLQGYTLPRGKNISKQRISSWIIQKNFTGGEKKLLKGLKMKYFRSVMMKKEKNKSLGIKKKKIKSEIKVVSLIMKNLRD